MIADCRLRIADSWLRQLGLVLVLVGYYGPWVPHPTSALTVTGFELAEFAKFFPQVQGGVVPIIRELFFTPLLAAAILLGLLANKPANQLTSRLVLTLAAALLALVALPPYQFLRDPQYARQLALAVGGPVLALLTPLTYRLSRRPRSILVAFLPLAGAAPALWQFALLRPLVVSLYNAPLGLGWGLVTCTAGFALLLICPVWPVVTTSVVLEAEDATEVATTTTTATPHSPQAGKSRESSRQHARSRE